MCGIAGVIRFDGKPVESHMLKRMIDAQRHRGPDEEGIYQCQGVGLAHRRLTIIDPQGGQQPFTDMQEEVTIVYNGEVYNFLEIRKELEPEFQFRTRSDTEVVLAAYRKWGIECLMRFRGMFAFALYDKKRKMAYVVRDRVGIKPLYYGIGKGYVVFASEVTAILVTDLVDRTINGEALWGYFKYQYVPTPMSIYNGINKLEPGCFLEIDVVKGRIEKRQYWDIQPEGIERDEKTCLEELNALLKETISLYVRSDVAFGAFLSGGTDSSLTTALMGECLDSPVESFAIGYDERDHSELPFAAEASRILGTRHHERIVSSEMSLEVLSILARHFGEPFADSSAIPAYHVSREASRFVKMVLSGDGGDELFGGYNSYQVTFRDHENPLHWPLVRACRLVGRIGGCERLRRFVQARGLDHRQKHRRERELFNPAELRDLMPGAEVDGRTSIDEGAAGWFGDPVLDCQVQDFKTYLVDDVLTKVDRMSMANSLEVRVPFLDHKIVELAFALPLRFRLRSHGRKGNIETKYLLKKAACRFFPLSFLNRPKMGFGIPIVDWCQKVFRGAMEDQLRDPRNPIYDLVSFRFSTQVLDAFYDKGQVWHANKIWALFMFDLWMREVHLGT